MLDKGIPYKSVWMVRTADEALPPVPTRADGFFADSMCRATNGIGSK